MERTKLGEMLLDANMLSDEQLASAVAMQEEVGGKLGHLIVKLGFIEEEVLANFIASQQGLEIADLTNLIIPETLVQKIPEKVIREHEVIPISFKDGVITLAMSDPTDYNAIEEIQFLTGNRIETVLSTRSSILRAMNEYFYSQESKEESLKDVLLRELEQEAPVAQSETTRLEVTPMQLRKALIPLLIEKGVITQEELVEKAKDLP